MSNFGNAPKKNALNNTKIRLVAKNSVGKLATLQLRLKKNNPQIQVYTNDPNDANNNYGRIDAALDTVVFNTWLEILRDAAMNPDFKKMPIRNRNFTFANGKRSETPVVVSELLVGRDEDGTVWTAVTARNRPMIKFEFIMPDFHTLMDNEGNPQSKGVASKYVTLGFINTVRDIMNHLQVTEWEEPAPRNNNGGGNGGGGGYQRNGGGNGGNGASGGGNGGGNGGSYQNNKGSGGSTSGDDFSGEDIW